MRLRVRLCFALLNLRMIRLPLSGFASCLQYFELCRREVQITSRRHRFLLFVLCASLAFLLPAHAQLGPQDLGSQAAAKNRAARFLAGRGGARSAATGMDLPTDGPRLSNLARPEVSRAAASTNLGSQWTAVGPATVMSSLYGAITGRVTSVALDPNDATGNTVWLGTTGGGVWKSTNAAGPTDAATFTPVTDTPSVFAANAGTGVLPSLSIGAVAVQPAANPVVLAGTGDPNDATDSYYGEGILRSADGGQTWTLATESQDGVNGRHTFTGLATAGLAWSTATPTLVVAAMSTSLEGAVVSAAPSYAVPGLYYSPDAGQTWRMAVVMDGGQVVQAPSSDGTGQIGAPATSVVWDAQRQMFYAAIQLHGYYSSLDGQNWTRLAHQPGTGLTPAHCPAGAGGPGSLMCPILRGTLAVQPATGDLYALTVDVANKDQGLWQDLCAAGSTGQCSTAAPSFSTRLDGGAMEVGQGAAGGSTQIPQGSYNLALTAAPASGGGTVLFAGTIDLYRCSLAAGASSCSLRNTTNAGNGCNASSAVAPAQHAIAAMVQASGAPLIYLGNDGGLWRSTDGVAQTGSPCASTDAAHFQNLNPAIGRGGSLAEVVGFAQDPSQIGTLIAGLGTLGSAASTSGIGSAAWQQMSGGEGGFPQIDSVSPANWYVAIGAGVNLKSCNLGVACSMANFLGSADVGALQTSSDAALLDAPILLDPQAPSSLLVGTCRVWRGPAKGGSGWNATSAISPVLDGGAPNCNLANALIRSLGVGGPTATSGGGGSKVVYAGMAGSEDGGGSLPGHLFVTKDASTANGTTPWTDVKGSPVQNSYQAFNASGFDISSVVVDSHDPTGGTVYATIMGFGTGPHVYRSLDFGAHWTNLSANLPSAPTNSLVVDPNDANTVYVALDTGVYVTQAVASCAATGQKCWSLLGSGLPNAPVTTLEAAAQLPTGDGRVGMLRAGTYGRGLWQLPLVTAHNLTQPQLSASPASLSFLAQPVGTQSDALFVTLLSFGNAPANITSVTVTGDFAETDTCTGQTLSPGQNCTVSVRFAPTAINGRSGLLTVYGNVPGGQVTVALSGTGSAPPAVVLTPLQLSFGATLVNQTAAAQIVTISNTGGNPATLQTPTITGDFSIAVNTCGTNLPSQTGCSVSITFSPKASGTRTGVLTVTDSAGTQTAQLTGTGQSPATDTLGAASLSFPAQQVGSKSAAQQVTLTNAGDIALALVTATVTGGDFTATSQCGTSLAAHSTCAVNVFFVPTATGARIGTLQVTDQFRTQTVTLSGAGVAPPGVSISPSTADFGSVGVGLTSSATSVVLTNNGGQPLVLSASTVSGDFSLVSSTCGLSLQPGEACTLAVAFAPRQAGKAAGALTLTDNATSGSQTVSLSGTGIDFALAANGPTSQTVASGAIATFPLRLTSLAGLSGTVNLTCAGAPSGSACTVNPAPAQLGGDVLVSVTLQTGLALTGRVKPPRPPSQNRIPILLCLLFVPVASPRRSRRVLGRHLKNCVLPFALLLCLAAGLCGCGATRLIPLGGTGGGGTGGGGATGQTAAGTYPLVITGSCAGVQHTVALTLVVQ